MQSCGLLLCVFSPQTDCQAVRLKRSDRLSWRKLSGVMKTSEIKLHNKCPFTLQRLQLMFTSSHPRPHQLQHSLKSELWRVHNFAFLLSGCSDLWLPHPWLFSILIFNICYTTVFLKQISTQILQVKLSHLLYVLLLSTISTHKNE